MTTREEQHLYILQELYVRTKLKKQYIFDSLRAAPFNLRGAELVAKMTDIWKNMKVSFQMSYFEKKKREAELHLEFLKLVRSELHPTELLSNDFEMKFMYPPDYRTASSAELHGDNIKMVRLPEFASPDYSYRSARLKNADDMLASIDPRFQATMNSYLSARGLPIAKLPAVESGLFVKNAIQKYAEDNNLGEQLWARDPIIYIKNIVPFLKVWENQTWKVQETVDNIAHFRVGPLTYTWNGETVQVLNITYHRCCITGSKACVSSSGSVTDTLERLEGVAADICNSCNGHGKVKHNGEPISPKVVCPTCKGFGTYCILRVQTSRMDIHYWDVYVRHLGRMSQGVFARRMVESMAMAPAKSLGIKTKTFPRNGSLNNVVVQESDYSAVFAFEVTAKCRDGGYDSSWKGFYVIAESGRVVPKP